jgi:diaminohydroxyphosphoribosylaminopyrimidine deaminase/5-amino-6-(5-phosphoribosylamino)uracil reductase
MWDEARIFSGKDFFRNGVKAPVLKGKLISEDIFSGSLLQVYTNEGF